MSCYFQGCTNRCSTREHIPPKSFFPDDQREQLFTVGSCEDHNQAKSLDDLYVLAHICMNASPTNGAREIFMARAAPQLSHNRGVLRNLIAEGCRPLDNGAVEYKVDTTRFDRFFDALSCGIVFKSCSAKLPNGYRIRHIYHNFSSDKFNLEENLLIQGILDFYSEPLDFMKFGTLNSSNEPIYSVKIFGIPVFKSSITVVHNFYEAFRVTSMLTQPTPEWAAKMGDEKPD